MNFEHTITGTGNVTGAVPVKLPLGQTYGDVYGIEVRVVSGTITSLLPSIARGRRSEGDTVKDSELCFESTATITTGLTASTTDSVVSERFEREGFRDGVTPMVDISASGAWELEVTVIAQPHTYERA